MARWAGTTPGEGDLSRLSNVERGGEEDGRRGSKGSDSVSARLARVRERIATACERCGRDPGDVVLIGASKRQTVQRMVEAWHAGLEIFGENQVQEAATKRGELPEATEWHLIGPLQSNKARRAVELFSTVHSLDRIKIARALDREAERQGKKLQGFLEINLGEEETKHGFAPRDLASQVKPLTELSHLHIVGLMAIPPRGGDVEASRPWFRRLHALRDELVSGDDWRSCPGFLSMGMSEDFDVAVEEGATHIRVGTALFGPRPPR